MIRLLTERKVGGFHDLRADSEEPELESHADHIGVVSRYIRHGELLLGMEPGRTQKGDAEGRQGGEAAYDAASCKRDTTWTTRAAHLRIPNGRTQDDISTKRITCATRFIPSPCISAPRKTSLPRANVLAYSEQSYLIQSLSVLCFDDFKIS